MKDQNIQKPGTVTLMFLSWFYTGKIPWAPGTMGSLATLPLILYLHHLKISLICLVALILCLYIIAVFLTHRVQKKFDLHDPQWIVIDEVIGMLITWSFVRTDSPQYLLMVFGLFRIFDIIKIWPASYFDKLHHGIGTITDDVISALYAGIISHLLISFL